MADLGAARRELMTSLNPDLDSILMLRIRLVGYHPRLASSAAFGGVCDIYRSHGQLALGGGLVIQQEQ